MPDLSSIVHYCDADAESLYHVLCQRAWKGHAGFVEPEKRQEGLEKFADGSYFIRDKKLREKVTCPGCQAKLS